MQFCLASHTIMQIYYKQKFKFLFDNFPAAIIKSILNASILSAL